MIFLIKEELEKAIVERYKQSKIASGIEDGLCELAQIVTENKYEKIKIKKGEWEYELLGAKASCRTEEYDFKLPNIDLILTFIVTSDITKQQKEQVKKCRDNYEYRDNRSTNFLDEKKFGKLWFDINYELEIEDILKEEINLEIEGIIS